RMNVDDAPWKSREHRLFQHAHETGEHDKVDTGFAQHSDQLEFGLWLETCPKLAGRQIRVRNAEVARDLENASVEIVGDYEPNFGCDFAVVDRVQNCAAVAALARPEDSELQPTHRCVC